MRARVQPAPARYSRGRAEQQRWLHSGALQRGQGRGAAPRRHLLQGRRPVQASRSGYAVGQPQALRRYIEPRHGHDSFGCRRGACVFCGRVLHRFQRVERRASGENSPRDSAPRAPQHGYSHLARHSAHVHAGKDGVALRKEYKRRRAIELTDIRDVWGIGRRLVRRLANYGISKAIHLADRTQDDVEQMLNITGMRTWRELNGEPCISVDSVGAGSEQHQKQICCTRSFGSNLTGFDMLADAMASFATIISRRLRERNLAAAGVSVFIHTNAMRDDLPQYYNSAYRPLAEPSNDTMTIAVAATDALRSIFRKGFGYKRAGIFITELSDVRSIQPSLFSDAETREKRRRLMAVVDSLNASSLSHDRVHIASYMPLESCVRCEHRSADFSTRLEDVIKVRTSI